MSKTTTVKEEALRNAAASFASRLNKYFFSLMTCGNAIGFYNSGLQFVYPYTTSSK